MKLQQAIFIFLMNLIFINCAVYTPSGGPVYVNPNSPPEATVPSQNTWNLQTQTVYGFLDFTTTIGNTVMIFSPQSSPVPTPEQPTTTTEASTTEARIETKPPTTSTPIQEVTEIKPSKTIVKAISKKELTSSNIVQVVAATPATPKPKPKKPKVTKPKKPKVSKVQIVSSHVEKVEETKATPVIAIVPVKEEPIEIVEETTTEKVVTTEEPTTPKVLTEKPTAKKTTTEKPTTPKPVTVLSVVAEVVTEQEPTTVSKVEEVTPEIPSIIEAVTAELEKEDYEDEQYQDQEPDQEQELEPEPELEQEQKQEEEPKQQEQEEEDEEEPLQQPQEEDEQEQVEEEQHHEDEDEEEEEEKDDEEFQPVLPIENNIAEPEYDFLSRQPSEFAEETYKVVNLKPSNSKSEQRPKTKRRQDPSKDDTHPTGLVTKLGGTVVKDGVTTVHETSVIGTYISGKYAQVLQSTSHLFQGNNKPKPTSSSSLRILKTAAPNIPKSPKYNVEPTPSSQAVEDTGLPESVYANQPSSSLIRPSRRPAIPSAGSFKNRFRNSISRKDDDVQDTQEEVAAPPRAQSYGNNKKEVRNNRFANAKDTKNTRYNRYSSSSTSVELATVSVFSESTTPSYASRRNKSSRLSGFKPTTTYSQASSTESFSRRGFKPKIQASQTESEGQSTSLYKFKLNRSPGRWQYKTSPKPRIPIRKQEGGAKDSVENLTTSPVVDTSVQYNDINQDKTDIDVDLDQEGSINGDILNNEETEDNGIERRFPVETVKVEISTPVDFKDTYYEIATIKSPYTFQVGTLKNTRYITVTSTFEKTLEPETPTVAPTLPLTENILATTSHIDKEHNLLDSVTATLPPISLAGEDETPPLETLTETFNTTQIMLKTHILPVIRGGTDTTSYTLIQTYHVTRYVTATKTLPPMELYQFVPSKTLNEFNSRLDEAGSELHLELEFGDENEHDEEDAPRRELPPDLDLSNIGNDFDLSEVDKTNIPDNIRPKKKISNKNKKGNEITTPETPTTPSLTQEQLQQLAYLRLLNPAAAPQIPNVITSSKPIVKLETVYESHVLPVINGQNTVYSTLSRAIGTITKTDYEIVTSTIPSLQLPPVPQLNPFQQQQQPQFQIQSTPVVTQTMVTQTNSKILKLTFGAKTAYTTLFSTKVVPTVLTTYVTQSVAVQPTASFPGFFPGPFGPYPFVG